MKSLFAVQSEPAIAHTAVLQLHGILLTKKPSLAETWIIFERKQARNVEPKETFLPVFDL